MTIVACSSAQPMPAQGVSGRELGRAIIRLSGPQAFTLAATVFSLEPEAAQRKRWRRVAGSVKWLTHTLPAHAYIMPSPYSYTRENVMELHVPALPWLVSALLDQLLSAGARMAQPGEFTRRAYENGRITLEQAEAVGALIRAQTADEARAYASKLQTTPQTQLTRLRADIEDLLALVELGLDFSQEDAGVLTPAEIVQRLARLRERAARLLHAAEHDSSAGALHSAELLATLPRVVLAGPVNAGKSSLFNALLKKDAAIVSAAAHTTRDAVESKFELPGGACVLNDTAGFHSESLTELQRAGVEASRGALARAHVLLVTLDGSRTPDAATFAMLRTALPLAKPALAALVWTKADLNAVDAPARLEAATLAAELLDPSRGRDAPNYKNELPQFQVSAQTGVGMDALRDFLAGAVAKVGSRHADSLATAAATGLAALRTAAAALERAHAALAAEHGEDVVAVELREALHAFWQTEGVLVRHDAVTEAMLDKIFATFCIGK